MGTLTLAVAVATVIACSKDKETKAIQSNNEIVTISKEDDMNAYLKQFKEKMQSASKGDETLSLEDARWHLEAVLNYTYGDAGHPTSDIQCDTFYYELPVNGDEVPLNRINEAFMALSKEVENTYTECNLPEKSVLAIQTTFENKRKEGNLIVQMILITRGFLTFKMWFDSTDYWSDYYYEDEYGNIYGGGKCGPYAGQCMNSGAPKELGKLSNLRIPQIGCRDGYRMYVTGEVDVCLNAVENCDFMMDENSPCGYKIYFNSNDPTDPSHNPSHCIPPDDMNYYLSKFTEIMNHYTPNEKCPICAMYLLDFLLSEDGDADLFWLIIHYATIHCEPQPSNEL